MPYIHYQIISILISSIKNPNLSILELISSNEVLKITELLIKTQSMQGISLSPEVLSSLQEILQVPFDNNQS